MCLCFDIAVGRYFVLACIMWLYVLLDLSSGINCPFLSDFQLIKFFPATMIYVGIATTLTLFSAQAAYCFSICTHTIAHPNVQHNMQLVQFC